MSINVVIYINPVHKYKFFCYCMTEFFLVFLQWLCTGHSKIDSIYRNVKCNIVTYPYHEVKKSEKVGQLNS